uniref:Effector protein n=1 Tax=Fusarium oxysporum f. sp. apii TaxID=224912 RepID=A0A866WLZ6_FUSOX|nr:effector protein [Fusarium oxysporum f. sp. apii]
MRFATFGLLVVLPTFSLAKDCGIFYDWSGTSHLDVWRDLKAVSMCSDIGGDIPNDELALKNGNGVHRCAVCRNARGGTKDYTRTITQQNDKIIYSVRCGWFGKGKCSA